MQQLAQLHGLYFIISELTSAVNSLEKQPIQSLMIQLFKLFSITHLQRLGEPIIESGFICPVKWVLLDQEKEEALRIVRPHVAVLLDSFGMPDKLLRSEVIQGNPY